MQVRAKNYEGSFQLLSGHTCTPIHCHLHRVAGCVSIRGFGFRPGLGSLHWIKEDQPGVFGYIKQILERSSAARRFKPLHSPVLISLSSLLYIAYIPS